jgi:hypothetical protein
MTDLYTFRAFLAVLVAIVVLYAIGAILAYNGKPMEALGLGGAGTGLIGILGTFKPRTTTPDTPQQVSVVNPSSDPVPTTNEEDRR